MQEDDGQEKVKQMPKAGVQSMNNMPVPPTIQKGATQEDDGQ